MSTVLLTGGAGFIGSHLAKRLIRDGYSVVCIDNLLTGSIDNIKDLLGKGQFHFIQADVTTFTAKQLVDVQKIDFVFHLASPASPNAHSPRSYLAYPMETLLVNSQGTKNMLDLAQSFSAKFLFTSSSEIYGDPLVSPQKESYFGNVNPNGVRSVYDEGKRFGEAITMAYVRKYNLDARVVRIFNTYGPFMQPDDGRVVSNFITQALEKKPLTVFGDGSQTRSFCFVDDMVEGIIRAMFTKGTKGEVFNLGNPDERTISELAKLILKLTNSSSQIVYEKLPVDDPRRRNPDITKARNYLHWSPKVSLEEGLQKTINFFRT
jgi:nucleoside-diphosphate-sugar epimerase